MLTYTLLLQYYSTYLLVCFFAFFVRELPNDALLVLLEGGQWEVRIKGCRGGGYVSMRWAKYEEAQSHRKPRQSQKRLV